MSKQTYFDLDSVTEDTKYRLKEPVDYYVFYVSVDTVYYKEEKDDWFSGGFGSERRAFKTFSKQIGHLNSNVHSSHLSSIIKQFREVYTINKLSTDWFRTNFSIPHGHNIDSVNVKYYKETIREIEVYE